MTYPQFSNQDPQDILDKVGNNSIVDLGHVFATKPLTLSNKSNVTIRGTIVGGVPTHEWQPLSPSDPLYSRIPVAARDNVWTTTAPIPGVNPFGTVTALPWGSSGNTRTDNLWPTLIWGNKAMTLARSPGYESSGSAGTLTTIKYTGTRPESYASLTGLCVTGYFGYVYAAEMRTVSGINTGLKELTCSNSSAGSVSLSNQRYFYSNVPEELDEPGEYYIDRYGLGVYGRIYFIPPGLVDPNTKPSYVSTAQGWTTPGPLLTLTSCTDVDFQCNLIGGVNKGLRTTLSNDMYLHDFTVSGMGRAGVDVWGDDLLFENMTIQTCIDQDMYLRTGDIKTFAKGNAVVRNCSFLNSAILNVYGSGALMLYGCGHEIDNCLFKDNYGQSLMFIGADKNIHDCEFNNVCTHMEDAGAIYWGRDPSMIEINIENCVFNNINNNMNPVHTTPNTVQWTACIHMDDGVGHATINNCTFNSTDRGINSNGGRYISVTNSTFNNCYVAWKYDGALTAWAYSNATIAQKSVASTTFTCNQSGFVAGSSTTMAITGLAQNLPSGTDVYFPSENIILELTAAANIGATSLTVMAYSSSPGPIANGSIGYTGGSWRTTTRVHPSIINRAAYLAAEPRLEVYWDSSIDTYRQPDGSSMHNATYNNCTHQVVRVNSGTSTFTET